MSLLRNTIGTALSGTAKVLAVGSKLLDATARTLRPDGTAVEEVRRPRPVADPISAAPTITLGDDDPRGRVVDSAPTPLLDETPHVRTSASHIEDLAAKPATEVTAAVSGLSTDELRLLTEYEMSHKNRRTVLTAIEKALVP
jgi:hypothetical protein